MADVITVLAGRSHLPALEGRGHVSMTLYRQDHPASLLFVLAGIGSNSYFGLGTYFAWLFHQQGFHVVIRPSPMSWNFALAASRSGAPGYAPADARDLYQTMQETLTILRMRYHVVTTRIGFLGASLGALDGAYLSVIDAQERKVGIDTYLLLNPPLDLTYALARVDEWNAGLPMARCLLLSGGASLAARGDQCKSPGGTRKTSCWLAVVGT